MQSIPSALLKQNDEKLCMRPHTHTAEVTDHGVQMLGLLTKWSKYLPMYIIHNGPGIRALVHVV